MTLRIDFSGVKPAFDLRITLVVPYDIICLLGEQALLTELGEQLEGFALWIKPSSQRSLDIQISDEFDAVQIAERIAATCEDAGLKVERMCAFSPKAQNSVQSFVLV